MEDDPLGIGDIEKRTRNAFRTVFIFIKRLREENEILQKKTARMENEIKELKKDLRNLTKIGDN